MYNKAILIGRLTTNPEMKRTSSGVSVVSFTLAVDRRFSGKDGDRKADFINCTAWRGTAEFICKHFGKGDPLGVEGSIQTRSYEDKNGNKRTAVEVVAENVFFVGSKKSDAREPEEPEASMPPKGQDDFEDDDLPF
ncbi:single-stranded DNA-binding protein [Angelakisella massiliensis]|uniref:single-stranded DNA-binding protein n=1 Tax=Angelakisella massiliensis TaxID=1871018 RepID=UPI0023A83070|nr:single-stranded DNA-binding protein [Angelakisella massiliensis]